MDKNIADFALEYAKSKKVDYAEVRAHSQKHEDLVMKNGILNAYVSMVDSGFCVRVLVDGGIGFASTNKWTKEEAKANADLAYKFAKIAKHRERISFAEEKSVKAD